MRFASLRPVIHSSWNSRIDLLHEWFILICTTKWYGSLKTQKNTVTVTAQHSATRITFVHMTVIIIAVYCISGWDIVQRIEPFINPEMCGYFSISSIVFEPNWFSSMQNVWIKAPYKRDTSVREKQRRQQQQQQQHFIRMKSHWIKWVRLFYTLFYIYIVMYEYVHFFCSFSLSFAWLLPKKIYIHTQKKTSIKWTEYANKPNLTLIKNKWHQVHTDTHSFGLILILFLLLFSDSIYLFIFRRLFFQLRRFCLRDQDSRSVYIFFSLGSISLSLSLTAFHLFLLCRNKVVQVECTKTNLIRFRIEFRTVFGSNLKELKRT